ncbi:MAG: 6-phosphogluconolactonase [Limisphaerales bacterium]
MNLTGYQLVRIQQPNPNMKRILFLTASLALMLTCTATQGAQHLFLANQSDGRIDNFTVDPNSGALTKFQSIEMPGNPGAMVFSKDKKHLYVAMQTGVGKERGWGISTLTRDQRQRWRVIGTAKAPMRAPYLAVDATKSFVLAAHYGDGKVTVQRIVNGIVTDEVTDLHTTEVTAHCIELDPSNRFAYVPHTRPNKVYQFKFDAKAGKLTPNNPPFVNGPATNKNFHMPRHIAFHPTLKMAFTSNERGGGISSWNFNPKNGKLKRAQTLSSLPPGFDGPAAAADIHITPNGQLAVVSNRHLLPRNAPKGTETKDTLALFSIDLKTGHLKATGHFPTENMPRSIDIDQTGNFIYAAGQKSNKLAAYRINYKSGSLTRIATYETGAVPIWVECLMLD